MLTTTHDFVAPRHPIAFTIKHRPPLVRRGLACWLALPTGAAADSPPLVTIHGIRRGARVQAALFAERAAALGRTVIAPIFDVNDWPRYQQVVHKQRADLALIMLMLELRRAGIWRTRSFDLAGYSGGAQYAHRFAMLYPHFVSRLTVASAGWYTFPDAAPFPYGFAAGKGCAHDWGPRMTEGLDQFLRLPIQVCVGAYDNVRDPNTRSGPEIDRQQGKNRLTRATRWVASLRQSATERGIASRVAMTVLPGCGHSFRVCVQRGGFDRLALSTADPQVRPLAATGGHGQRDLTVNVCPGWAPAVASVVAGGEP